jgi:hypothetical protein
VGEVFHTLFHLLTSIETEPFQRPARHVRGCLHQS